ncbi:hypothetical protein GDO78_014989 [Eleutherodactylus coqui]|uniref:Uncharacterized protein n=1 Tax=Eleutherodactylus coqui TaxID=57060 RepID=A0A8J6EBZ4_ELECQ|nr:hypothetical protein GDO78_014989 [Eleutherodactylus coqui]
MLSRVLPHASRGQPLSSVFLCFKLSPTYSLPWKQRQVKSQYFEGILTEFKRNKPTLKSPPGQSLRANGF